MLSILLVLPMLTMLTILFPIKVHTRTILATTLSFSILSLIHTNFLVLLFDTENAATYQTYGMENGILAVDGISLWLIWLVNMLMPIVILSVYKSVKSSAAGSTVPWVTQQALLLLVFIGFWSIAVFIVQDIRLFYISFEGALLPMYFLIIHYGSRNKKLHASYMFFLYTLAGSLCLFLALLGLYLENGTGDYQILVETFNQGLGTSHDLIWIAFFICFCIKLPIIGFHGWLLAAHVESPTAGSVILAAILLKMGSYGLIRYNLALFPDASEYYRPLVLVICLLSVIYSAIAALSQSDFKLIIAYSSIGHMGTATIGLFSNDYLGIQGSIYFLISHGLISSALFLLVGVIYERYHSRQLLYYRGLVQAYPVYVLFLLIFSMANSAIPLSSGFVGEIMSLLGAFHLNPFVAIIGSLSIVLVPSFMLKLLHTIAYGSLTRYMPVLTSDLTYKELMMFGPLTYYTFYFGINPQCILNDLLEPSLNLIS